MYSGKLTVFGKSGCIRTIMVVLGEKMLYSDKVVVFRQSSCNGEKWFIRKKLVVFG